MERAYREMDIVQGISYLKEGSSIQRDAFACLEELDLFNKLKEYNPILAGTIPLGVNIEGSDLDIICQSDSLESFAAHLKNHYGDQSDFSVSKKTVRDRECSVIRFNTENFQIEIFAQNQKSIEQYAVVHMMIEKRILDILGDEALEDIRKLKESGLKTEPAFCQYLGIEGDPYDELAKLNDYSDAELSNYLKSRNK